MREIVFEQNRINVVGRIVVAAVVQPDRLHLHADWQVEEVIEKVLEGGQQHRTWDVKGKILRTKLGSFRTLT